MTENQTVIDVDALEEVPSNILGGVEVKVRQDVRLQVGEHKAIRKAYKPPRKWQCEGYLIKFPEETNHHLSYPFGIHSERSVPWNY